MDLTLYFHPLSSYCHKVLIALYENGVPFDPKVVNLSDPAERAEFLKLNPIGKFPVIRDGAGRAISESTIIIEYLDQHHPGATRLIPADADKALDARRLDRFFDLHIHHPMQEIVADRLRPADKRDTYGLQRQTDKLNVALAAAERDLGGKTWALGDEFCIADCAAAPALFYADLAVGVLAAYPGLVDYLARLKARPSYARVLEEAEPFFKMVPKAT